MEICVIGPLSAVALVQLTSEHFSTGGRLLAGSAAAAGVASRPANTLPRRKSTDEFANARCFSASTTPSGSLQFASPLIFRSEFPEKYPPSPYSRCLKVRTVQTPLVFLIVTVIGATRSTRPRLI